MGIFTIVRAEWKAVLMCFIVTFAAMQFGFDSTYFSGVQVMQPFLAVYGHYDSTAGKYVLSAKVLSLVTSIINVGEFVGACSAFWIGDKFGLKKGLYVATFFVVIGTILQVAGTVEASLVCGRLLLGYAVGLISCFVPLYVADCAPAGIRGFAVSTYQFLIGIGLIMGLSVAYTTSTRTDTGSYRIPMAVQLLFPIVFCTGLITFAPESPRWLFRNKGPDAAAGSLRRLNGKRSTNEIQAELTMMEAAAELAISDNRHSSWKQVFTWGPDGRKAWLGFSLQALQQGTGINFITGYGVAFFFSIGIKNAFLISLGLYLVATPAVFVSAYLIERFGRRPILLGSGIAVASVLIIMGAMGLVVNKNEAEEKLIVTMVYLFLFFFNVGWGPTVWVVCSELSTGPNRGKLMSVSTASNWFWNWLVSFTFPYLFNADAVGLGPKIGFIYGGLTVLACVWIWLYLPETAGRSLEEIDEMFEKGVPARKFSSYVCSHVNASRVGEKQNNAEELEVETIEKS